MKIGESLYKTAPPPNTDAPNANANNDKKEDVVDAEFTEKK